MRCINKVLSMLLVCAVVLCAAGCGNIEYSMPYNTDMNVSTYDVLGTKNGDLYRSFAGDLCVVADNIDISDVDMSGAYSAGLFDLSNKEVIYAKNVHEQLHPASLTKIMTAVVALKYGSLDQVLTASKAVNIAEPGAQLCGLKSGDSMTLDQALHILLINSANDVAMLIAENIGGTPEGFIEMMNAEARNIGATNTNFMNPHGLTQENHYSTPYDMYLIFNEAVKYEKFNEIIHMTGYSTIYRDKNGKSKELNVKSTNLFLQGHYEAPAEVTVIGGKTGTTNAAGHCLILLSRDVNGNPYVSVIMRSEARDVLYKEMVDLLDEISK